MELEVLLCFLVILLSSYVPCIDYCIKRIVPFCRKQVELIIVCVKRNSKNSTNTANTTNCQCNTSSRSRNTTPATATFDDKVPNVSEEHPTVVTKPKTAVTWNNEPQQHPSQQQCVPQQNQQETTRITKNLSGAMTADSDKKCLRTTTANNQPEFGTAAASTKHQHQHPRHNHNPQQQQTTKNCLNNSHTSCAIDIVVAPRSLPMIPILMSPICTTPPVDSQTNNVVTTTTAPQPTITKLVRQVSWDSSASTATAKSSQSTKVLDNILETDHDDEDDDNSVASLDILDVFGSNKGTVSGNSSSSSSSSDCDDSDNDSTFHHQNSVPMNGSFRHAQVIALKLRNQILPPQLQPPKPSMVHLDSRSTHKRDSTSTSNNTKRLHRSFSTSMRWESYQPTTPRTEQVGAYQLPPFLDTDSRRGGSVSGSSSSNQNPCRPQSIRTIQFETSNSSSKMSSSSYHSKFGDLVSPPKLTAATTKFQASKRNRLHHSMSSGLAYPKKRLPTIKKSGSITTGSGTCHSSSNSSISTMEKYDRLDNYNPTFHSSILSCGMTSNTTLSASSPLSSSNKKERV